ncbi:MAG: hypothetical protein E7480_01085 [Ruminococcaceae bacterium]|nr:hypothetical protein [Oscillospiraceae bacterium]
MKAFEFKNKYYRYIIGTDDEGHLFHGCFIPSCCFKGMSAQELFEKYRTHYSFEFVLKVDHEPFVISHGVRAFYTETSKNSVFRSLKRKRIPGGTDNIVTLECPEKNLLIKLHYEVYQNSPAIRRYTEVENKSGNDILLNHISSFTLSNFPYSNETCQDLYLHSFSSQWSYEGTPNRNSFADLGVLDHYCRNGYAIESTGTWVCQQYFPYFVIEQKNSKIFTAVSYEYSSAWRFEIGTSDLDNQGWFYTQGGMGNDLHAHWNKILKNKESFCSPRASITTAYGNLEKAFNHMHLHQQNVLIHRSETDKDLPVIYNDWPYMQADVTEEKILEQLDTLKDCSVDIYVTDAGWFCEQTPPKNDWWVMAGQWEYDKNRFPHGLKYITDRIKEKGMKSGIWCEIEAIGPMADIYNDYDMILMRDGRPVCDAKRHFLNFSSQKGRDYATKTFDKIVEWGFDYVKIDYNMDSAPGCDTDDGDVGQGLHKNRMDYYAWIDSIREKYPQLIIENCSSGGMRLEYGMLSRTDMASITDQASHKLMGALYYNVSKLIHPSQCGIWSYLEDQFTEEDYIFALTNSMMGRMHLSGNLVKQSESKKKILLQAVKLYKKYRKLFYSCYTIHYTKDFKYYKNNIDRALEIRNCDKTSSIICVQRPENGKDKLTIKPRGLKNGDYKLEFFPSGKQEIISSSQLAQSGIEFNLPYNFSAELVYLHKI